MEHSNFQQHATPETIRIMAFLSKHGLRQRSPRLALALQTISPLHQFSGPVRLVRRPRAGAGARPIH